MSAGQGPGCASGRDRPGSGRVSVAPVWNPVHYRCASCGNLTRFDVVATRKTRAFYHYSIGGELTVEDEQVLEEVIDEVTCRWCGHGTGIELIEGPVVAPED